VLSLSSHGKAAPYLGINVIEKASDEQPAMWKAQPRIAHRDDRARMWRVPERFHKIVAPQLQLQVGEVRVSNHSEIGTDSDRAC
jgi:hypothetical protein